jgi:ABC-type glutathione transport system ATPase component
VGGVHLCVHSARGHGVSHAREAALRTVGLVKAYGATEALAGVDFEVPAGSVYGLVGPNGSGKTTALVGGFSRGMRSRLVLAAGLTGDPLLLLADEPAAALDPAGRVEILELLAGLAGLVTVIVSSHDLADVERICDRIGVLVHGRLVYQGDVATLLVVALLGNLRSLTSWVPTRLARGLAMFVGRDQAGDAWRPAVIAAALSIALLVLAVNRFDRRQL